MERSLVLVLLLSPCFLVTVFPLLSQALAISLHRNWSFSADLSLASPLPLNAFSSPSLSLFTPILSSPAFSSGKGFSLGFYSLFSSSSSPLPTSIFLTVCLGTNRTDMQGRTFAVPVWHFDRKRPLKQVDKGGLVSLSVNAISKELVLRDGDGSVVYSMGNVEAMEMQDNGNWALYGAKNQVVWQSFDHPSDTLLQGQYLKLGMKLESNNSLYIAEMMQGGLVFYYNARAPAHLTYWAVPVNISVVQYAAQHPFELSKNPSINLTHSLEYDVCPSGSSSSHPAPYALFYGSNLTVWGACSSFSWSNFGNIFQNSTLSSDFFILANDGYPKGYTYLHILGQNLLFSGQANASYCLAPFTCGSYGICDELLFGLQHSCRCPSVLQNPDFEDTFTGIDPSDPTQGCRRKVPLKCSDGAGAQSLVEIKKSSIVPIHPLYETTYMHNTFPLPECIARCAHNCSCSGFFYHQGSSFCLPFSDDGEGDVPNLTFITLGSSEFSTYIKIQHRNGEGRLQVGAAAVTSKNSSHLSKAVVIVIGGGVLVLALLVCAIATLLTYKHLKRLKNIEEEELEEAGDEELRKVLPKLPVRFSYKELDKATGGFSMNNIIGSGGFGCVYQGVLPDGRKVAVKKLDQGSPRLKQFLAEVAIIGDVSHFNIAPLCGFCSQKSHRLLVYEFMENGSLDKWLFSDCTDRLLNWNTRYQIALGTARGLAYLHEECPRPIIHFDVKPQNILLDKEFVAKISDFGMCKLVGRAESSCVMTGVRGTPGYLAPEWLSYTVVGKKCDVYSYGKVLLEMVGGRKNAVQALVGSEQWYFPMWAATLCKQGRYKDLVDKRLEGMFDEEQVRRIIHVAFLCIQREPSLRPSMGDVCKMIEGSLPLGDEDPPFDLALEPLSPEQLSSLSDSCTSTLLVGR